MPRRHIKNKYDRLLPSVIACGVLIAAAMAASVLLPIEKAPAAEAPREVVTTTTATAAFHQQLKAWEGRLARFVDGRPLPEEIYDVSILSLPPDVQEQLAVGITVTSEEELYRLLDNFTS